MGGLNKELRDPTSQPEKYILHFLGIWYISQKIAMVQKYPNIGIRMFIRIYQNDSECRMGMNGEDIIG